MTQKCFYDILLWNDTYFISIHIGNIILSNETKQTERGIRMKNKTILMEKIKESLASVMPVSLIILVLSLTITPLPNAIFISFLFGTFFMIFGMGLFTLGVDKSMTPMG